MKKGPRRKHEDPGPRHQAREAAVQALYAVDTVGARGKEHVSSALQAYWSHLEGPAAGRTFADELVQAVMARRDQLDEAIRDANPAWRIERMACVDRNILRLAAYEIIECSDIPAHIAIDEAVELAKRFGTEDSPAFVNGTLDKLARLRGKL